MINEHIENAKIMIIDEDVGMMDVIATFLRKYGHQVISFTEPISAIEALKFQNFDILIVNYLISPITGDKIIELVRQFNKDIYIILMSTHKDIEPSIELMKSLDIQGYFEKSSNFDQLMMLIQNGIRYTEQLKNVKKINTQMDNYLLDFANILLKTVDAKDNYTAAHSYRVSKICGLFSGYLNLNKEDYKSFTLAGLFHDIGKIGIPDYILSKTDKLTDSEYETIKLHPIIGANILSVCDMFKTTAPAIRSHHEKYDGTGYPLKLKGENIPYLARALSLCDAFDAIVSERPYKKKKSINYAIQQIKKSIGTYFDPVLSKLFLKMLKEKEKEINEILNAKQFNFNYNNK